MLEEKVLEQTQSEKVEEANDRPSEVGFAVALLYVFAVIGVFNFLFVNVAAIIGIVINLALAHGLLNMKSWARTWTIIRSIAGVVFTLVLLVTLPEMPENAVNLTIILSIFDLGCFTAIILMLTRLSVRKAEWN